MSDCIPIDVWAKILCRLQVKPLLRFRSVSQSFCHLIDSRYFVRLHLDYSAKMKLNRKILVTDDQGVLSVDYNKFNRAIRRSCPMDWSVISQYVSSFHGIVMLFDGRDEFMLWNPSRRRYIHVTLPAFSISSSRRYGNFNYSLGFGYNDADDDYKVVKVHHIRLYANVNNPDLLDQELLKKVEVYSLKTNSWRRVQNFPFNLRRKHHHAIFVSGAMHWVCQQETNAENNGSAHFIVAFDLRTEEYKIVPAPQYKGSKFSFKLIIGSLEGRLWAHCYSKRSDLAVQINDTWVMNEYGRRESWAKLFPLPEQIHLRQPVAYSKGGNYLLIDNYGSFQWYDLLSDGYEDIRVRGLYLYYKADLCFESLVRLNAGENNDDNQQIRENVLMEDSADNDDDSIFSMVANFFTDIVEAILYWP